MLIVVTNRLLCREDFYTRLQKIVKARPDRIILREKDLDENGYLELARRCGEICRRGNVPLSLNTHWRAALELGMDAVHLPLPVFMENEARLPRFSTLGVSVHSPEEARQAADRGAAYLTAGHIYETGCKQGLPGRGLPFLKEVCAAVPIPVYAIGGVTPQRVPALLEAGARGVCVMSDFMICDDPVERMSAYREALSLDNAGKKV